MGIFNRRNAVIGWAAWQVAKRVLKSKARAAVPGTADGSRRPNLSAILLAVGAAAAALAFWRRLSGDSDSDSFE